MHPHAPFLALLVDFGYPLRRHAVFLRYLEKTDDSGWRSPTCAGLSARSTHGVHQASESGRLQHQRVEHLVRLFSHVQQHCSQGSKVRHSRAPRPIGYLSTNLFCASPLWAACEATDTDLRRTAWTSSSPARPWNRPAPRQCLHLWPRRPDCCLARVRTSCGRAKRSHTHPSRSISSVLKANTWKQRIGFRQQVKLVNNPELWLLLWCVLCGGGGELPVRPSAGSQSERRGWRAPAEPPGWSWS